MVYPARGYHFDEAVYQSELQNIFCSSWQYACHVSKLAQPGAYAVQDLGDHRVLPSYVTRKANGCEAFQHDMTHPAMIESTPITYPYLDWAGFLYDANLAGMPACSVPMGIGDEGLPLGLQTIGLPNHDIEVLQAAQLIEQALKWQHPEFDVKTYADSALIALS